MIVDTSAIIAIIKQEPEARLFQRMMVEADVVLMSVANLLELHMVITDYRASAKAPALLESLRVASHAVSEAQLELAKTAHDRYGRGSGHKAALNYGDCFAYALAKATGQPLLFKGDDFALTDVEAVPY